MRGRRRGGGGIPMQLIAIVAGVVLVAGIGSVFWFSGEAEKKAPEPTEIRVEAKNVGSQ